MEKKITAWVARDKNDVLTFFENEPIKSIDDDMWVCSDSNDNIITLLGDEFLFNLPNIQWEDEKPTKIELTIKVCE